MMPSLSQQIMGQGTSVIATPGPSGLATGTSMSSSAPLVMPGMLPPGTPGMLQPSTPAGILPPVTPGITHGMIYPPTPNYPGSSSSLQHIEDMPHLPADQVKEMYHIHKSNFWKVVCSII